MLYNIDGYLLTGEAPTRYRASRTFAFHADGQQTAGRNAIMMGVEDTTEPTKLVGLSGNQRPWPYQEGRLSSAIGTI